MFLTGLGTSTPPSRFTQSECWNVLERADVFRSLPRKSKALLRHVLLGSNGINSRHLAVENLEEVFKLTPDALHARFTLWAPALATQAADRALHSAGLDPPEIDAVVISTCTGYLCPGLTSYVAERLGLRPDVIHLDLVGQGCGAALPNLGTAEALLASRRCGHVLSVCVEVCSAALYIDSDPGVLISACLFGDAGGAVVASGNPVLGKRRIEWSSSESTLVPTHRDLLRFESRNGMLRNILTKPVPSIAAASAEEILRRLLLSSGISRTEITTWILHAGGRDVLSCLRDRLALTEEDVRWSATVLAGRGNISSPFVLHVLEEALQQGAPDGIWFLSSFGAGFSCHGALLNVSRDATTG